MRLTTRFSILLLLTALPAAADCRYEAPIDETIDAANIDLVRIEVAAGSLDIVGKANLDAVHVRGKACASSEDLLAEIGIKTDRRGDDVSVIAMMPESDWGLGRRYAYLDLVIEVPTSAGIDVEDSSGDMEIRSVRSARIEDGSGSIRLEDVDEQVRVDDGSGDVDIRDVRGAVWIHDGSGSVEIDRAGEVDIDSDGSGDLTFRDIQGNVLVRTDGSGSIRANGVGGDFTVEDDGSGDIDHRDVAGRVSVPR